MNKWCRIRNLNRNVHPFNKNDPSVLAIDTSVLDCGNLNGADNKTTTSTQAPTYQAPTNQPNEAKPAEISWKTVLLRIIAIFVIIVTFAVLPIIAVYILAYKYWKKPENSPGTFNV